LKTKIIALVAITIIALLTTSYAFACASVNPPNNHGNSNIEYTTAKTSDNENTNLASIHIQIAPDHCTINVQIENAYPNYEAQIAYTLKNTGNYRIGFNTPTIINPNPEAIQIITTNHKNTIIQPGQTTQGITTVRILPNAQQSHQYTFKITNIASAASPETCHPHRVTFWVDQLRLYLNGKCSEATTDSSTFERYLDQVSDQSKIFKFTGSQTQKFQQVLNALNPSNGGNSETNVRTQLLALWLNQKADWTTHFTIDNKNSNTIIQNTETILIKHQTNQYQISKTICESFNNLD
jgi:hypothetical protein